MPLWLFQHGQIIVVLLDLCIGCSLAHSSCDDPIIFSRTRRIWLYNRSDPPRLNRIALLLSFCGAPWSPPPNVPPFHFPLRQHEEEKESSKKEESRGGRKVGALSSRWDWGILRGGSNRVATFPDPGDIAGTGSDLNWTQCKPCSPCYPQQPPIFDLNRSSSYNLVPVPIQHLKDAGKRWIVQSAWKMVPSLVAMLPPKT